MDDVQYGKNFQGAGPVYSLFNSVQNQFSASFAALFFVYTLEKVGLQR